MERRFTILLILSAGLLAGTARADEARAVFAGGCFWCMEEAFEAVEGVSEVISGYAGGSAENATYREVSSGRTAHAEVVEVRYDPTTVDYRELLQVFWLNVDPTTANRQFCDRGPQYRSAIFFANGEQERLARESLALVEAQKPFAASVATTLEPLTAFYPAEAYHQDYYRTNALRYNSYKYACGRKQRLKEVWDGREQPFVWPDPAG